MEEKSVPKEVVFQGQNEDADLFFQWVYAGKLADILVYLHDLGASV